MVRGRGDDRQSISRSVNAGEYNAVLDGMEEQNSEVFENGVTGR